MVKLTSREILKMRIKRVEKEIHDTPYHKGTEHHIGKLRAKLAHLKDSEIGASTKKGGGGTRYAVKKQGDATVVLVGHPSVGKSTLLNRLTNARSKVAPYAFTTVTVIPGMMKYQDAKIQILDVPGLIEGAEEGKGRGREVLSVARGADLLIIIGDLERTSFVQIEKVLHKNGIRLNQKPPRVEIEKKLSGGIIIHTNVKQEIDRETIKEVAGEMGIKNAEITIEEKLTFERLIDAFSNSRVYVPGIFVVNKIDQKQAFKKNPNYFYISAQKSLGLNTLKKVLWQKTGLIRVYLVKEGEEPHYLSPIVTRAGQTLKDIAIKIGNDFAQNKKRAKIWGQSAKYPGQVVSLSKEAKEGMRVCFLV